MFEDMQDIETVKEQEGGGWTVNGNASVPNAPGNRHYHMIQQWLAKGNKAEPFVPPAPPEEVYSKLDIMWDKLVETNVLKEADTSKIGTVKPPKPPKVEELKP